MKTPLLFCLLALLSCPCAGLAQSIPAQEGWKDAQFPMVRRTNVGANEVCLIALKRHDLPVGVLAVKTDEEKAALQRVYPDGKIPAALNVMLIKGTNRAGEKAALLVDTGLPDTVESLLAGLAQCGVRAEEVQFVLLTHGHSDHIGGLLKEGKPTFPNAKLVLCDREFEFWNNDANQPKAPEMTRPTFALFQKTMQAYEGRRELVQTSALAFTPNPQPGVSFSWSAETIPGVSEIPTFGHTPGHMAVLVTPVDASGQALPSDKETLFFWGDLLHAFTYQTEQPQVSPVFDGDPQEAAQTRADWLKMAQQKGWYCTGVHMPGPFTWKLPSPLPLK